LCGATAAVVELAEGGDMVYRAAAGVAEGALGLRLKREGSLSGLCVAQDKILQCDDSETDPRVDRAACRKVGLRSMLVVPLRHEGETVGVLKVGAPHVNAFDARQAQILGLLSELIGAAIYHAVQYESSDLYYRATHDALTRLANRALFYDRLRQQLAQASRACSNVAIVNIDMDGLKTINDNLGHRAGDAAICQVAEFGIILCGVRDRDGVGRKCTSITNAIGAPFEFEGRALRLGASIGYAICPEDGQDMDQLIELADQAMYRIKHARKAVAA
jgi:GGDEF domain-containing protein